MSYHVHKLFFNYLAMVKNPKIVDSNYQRLPGIANDWQCESNIEVTSSA